MTTETVYEMKQRANRNSPIDLEPDAFREIGYELVDRMAGPFGWR